MSRDLKNQMVWHIRSQRAMTTALLMLVAISYLFGIRPASAKLSTLQQSFAFKKTELQSNQERAKDLPKVETEIQRLKQRVERFDKKLPKQQDLSQFISDITAFGQETSLSKLNWKPDVKPRRTDQFSELPIQFSFQGDFLNVFDFLRRTEDMQRLTRVRKLDIKSKLNTPGQVDVQLTMNIYFAEE